MTAVWNSVRAPWCRCTCMVGLGAWCHLAGAVWLSLLVIDIHLCQEFACTYYNTPGSTLVCMYALMAVSMYEPNPYYNYSALCRTFVTLDSTLSNSIRCTWPATLTVYASGVCVYASECACACTCARLFKISVSKRMHVMTVPMPACACVAPRALGNRCRATFSGWRCREERQVPRAAERRCRHRLHFKRHLQRCGLAPRTDTRCTRRRIQHQQSTDWLHINPRGTWLHTITYNTCMTTCSVGIVHMHTCTACLMRPRTPPVLVRRVFMCVCVCVCAHAVYATPRY